MHRKHLVHMTMKYKAMIIWITFMTTLGVILQLIAEGKS